MDKISDKDSIRYSYLVPVDSINFLKGKEDIETQGNIMIELFRIKNKNSRIGHEPMIYDRMNQELMRGPLNDNETLESSKDGGKAWKDIGNTLPEKKVEIPKNETFSYDYRR